MELPRIFFVPASLRRSKPYKGLYALFTEPKPYKLQEKEG